MVAWCYNDLVEETIRWFALRAVPDAGDWQSCGYSIYDAAPDEAGGHAWRIEADIPVTEAALPCWLSFVIVEPPMDYERVIVRDISAVRSGRGEHEYETYSWNDNEGMWVLLPEEDGE